MIDNVQISAKSDYAIRAMLELAAHGVKLCPLHRRVDNALAMVEKAFAETTLREIIDEPTESVPLCDFPNKNRVELPTDPRR